MLNHYKFLCVLFGSLALPLTQLQALNLTDFTTCVSSSGSGTTCPLDAGSYSVLSTIPIRRNGITVTGTLVSGAIDTTLQRTSTLGAGNPILIIEATGVTVENLTLDGDRGEFPR
jgi:hypothetical protein